MPYKGVSLTNSSLISRFPYTPLTSRHSSPLYGLVSVFGAHLHTTANLQKTISECHGCWHAPWPRHDGPQRRRLSSSCVKTIDGDQWTDCRSSSWREDPMTPRLVSTVWSCCSSAPRTPWACSSSHTTTQRRGAIDADAAGRMTQTSQVAPQPQPALPPSTFYCCSTTCESCQQLYRPPESCPSVGSICSSACARPSIEFRTR